MDSDASQRKVHPPALPFSFRQHMLFHNDIIILRHHVCRGVDSQGTIPSTELCGFLVMTEGRVPVEAGPAPWERMLHVGRGLQRKPTRACCLTSVFFHGKTVHIFRLQVDRSVSSVVCNVYCLICTKPPRRTHLLPWFATASLGSVRLWHPFSPLVCFFFPILRANGSNSEKNTILWCLTIVGK